MTSVNDKGKAADGFGVVSTVVGTAVCGHDISHRIEPAQPVRKRPSGRMDFPSGVILVPAELATEYPIHVEGLGFVTRGIAESLAASLAGAVRALAEREARELSRQDRAEQEREATS